MTSLSAKQRLALSRNAISRHMARGRLPQHDEDERMSEDPALAPRGTWGKLKFLARSWWRNHPVNYAVQIARPSIDEYAAQEPFKMVGIAAAVGAAAMVIKPWKILPLTALLLAPLKSSGFTSTAVTLFAPPNADGA
ncbi:hypothetical protein RD110_16280 [Rhodoferax koreense]|uniref:Uncharacterized protein n=1 Tax=Rhodoferax koreensis TaxID=1842727 RepID=A0A1P8K490_9BURK|nr:hypothetical protein RD110_16280 [Rhodoferax koreense]